MSKMDLLNSFGNRVFNTGDIYSGSPSKIQQLSNTIKVAYHGANGTLRIYQSPNGKLWDYYEEFQISGNSFAQSGINGNYYYIKYIHGTGTNTITLSTNTSNQIHNNFDVNLTDNDVVSVAGLTFTQDGALIVSSAGGGTAGDASASNQETQIEIATASNVLIDGIKTLITNRVSKCNTDSVVIESSTPVNTLNLAKVYNTLNNGYITVDSDQNLRVAGNVNINSTKRGAKNNVHSGLLDAGAFTGFFNVSLYGKDAIISYDDASIYRTNTFSIFGSLTEVADDRAYLGSLVPVVAGSKRLAASKIDLGPFNYLCVQNNDSTQSITSNISVYSS